MHTPTLRPLLTHPRPAWMSLLQEPSRPGQGPFASTTQHLSPCTVTTGLLSMQVTGWAWGAVGTLCSGPQIPPTRQKPRPFSPHTLGGRVGACAMCVRCPVARAPASV